MNFFRYFLPDVIAYCIAGSQQDLNHMPMFFTSDIMQFAGLAFLTLAVFRKAGLSSLKILFVSIGMNLMETVLAGCQTGFYPLDQLLGFFWGTYTESYFPLLNWFVFVAGGRCFGEWYTHLTNKKKLYERIMPFTFVISAAYILAASLPQQHIFLIAAELTGLSWMRLPESLYFRLL